MYYVWNHKHNIHLPSITSMKQIISPADAFGRHMFQISYHPYRMNALTTYVMTNELIKIKINCSLQVSKQKLS